VQKFVALRVTIPPPPEAHRPMPPSAPPNPADMIAAAEGP